VLRDVTGDRDAIEANLAAVRSQGLPNYFGAQRFGFEGGNVTQGRAMLARDVVERAKVVAQRVERAGETVFCYAADVEPVLALLRGQHELVYLHRPANLEDLFLKLTGRDLRD